MRKIKLMVFYWFLVYMKRTFNTTTILLCVLTVCEYITWLETEWKASWIVFICNNFVMSSKKINIRWSIINGTAFSTRQRSSYVYWRYFIGFYMYMYICMYIYKYEYVLCCLLFRIIWYRKRKVWPLCILGKVGFIPCC